MYLTYLDSFPSISVVLPANAGVASDLEIERLEAAYSAWEGQWSHALVLGGFGDLRELRDALNSIRP